LVSVDPVIAYYHDGFLKLSVLKYDRKSKDKAVHLANTEMAKDKFDQARNSPGGYMGMNEPELRAF